MFDFDYLSAPDLFVSGSTAFALTMKKYTAAKKSKLEGNPNQ